MADNNSLVTNSSTQYQKQLLSAMKVAPVFEQFALRASLQGTKNIAWNRVNRISPGTPAPMTRGVSPSPLIQTPDEVTATAAWYAAYCKIDRESYKTDPNGQVKAMGEAMGIYGSELREVIIRNALISGSSVACYAGSAINSGSRSSLTGVISLTDLNRISRALYGYGAEHITSIKKASSGFNTYPIGASYIVVIHSHIENDVRALSGFIPVERYADSTPGFIGEIGAVPGYRFIKSNIMSDMYYPGSSTVGGSYGSGAKLSDDDSHCNVYPCIVFGKESFGVVDLEKLEMIEKGLNEAGSPVDAYATKGWIMANTAKVLNPYWCAIYEVAATA